MFSTRKTRRRTRQEQEEGLAPVTEEYYTSDTPSEELDKPEPSEHEGPSEGSSDAEQPPLSPTPTVKGKGKAASRSLQDNDEPGPSEHEGPSEGSSNAGPLPFSPTPTVKGKGKAASTSLQDNDVTSDDKGREVPPHLGSSHLSSPYISRGRPPTASGSTTRTPNIGNDFASRLARELYIVVGPLPSFKRDEETTVSSNVRRFFRTTTAVSKVKENPSIQPRYLEALRLGYIYLGRTLPAQYNIRSLKTTPQKFIREIIILDQIAQGETARSVELDTAYQVPASYQELLQTLQHIRSLLDMAHVLPQLKVPKWGAKDDHWKEFWSSNDYEILTVCYRLDVENFFIDTHKYIERNAQGFFVLKRGVTLPEPDQRPQSRIKDEENTTSNPMLTDHSISQANTFERMYQKNQARFYGSSEPTTKPFSYLSSPLKYAPTASLVNILSDEPPVADQPQPMQYEYRMAGNAPEPGGDPSDDSDEDYGGRGPPNQPPRNPRGNHNPDNNGERGNGYQDQPPAPRPNMVDFRPMIDGVAAPRQPEHARFDLKLKLDAIPEWDGNTDNLGTWIIKLNTLSRRSPQIYQQLGSLVPMRLTKSAESWYFSLPSNFRADSERNWGTLKSTITGYYMNRHWISRQKELAEKAKYRQLGHNSETPSEYYIRKSQLLSLVYTLTDQETIDMVMRGAPDLWTSILTTHLLSNLVEFQAALRHHEESLIRLGNFTREPRSDERVRPTSTSSRRLDFRKRSKFKQRRATAHAVGWNPNMPPPSFPKDDSTVSTGKTPEQKGARPCRHCGSAKHWDKDCKYARQARQQARSNSVKATAECKRAQAQYDALYYATDTTTESDSESSDEESESAPSVDDSAHQESLIDINPVEQDFCEPSQISVPQKAGDARIAVTLRGETRLGGNSALETGKANLSYDLSHVVLSAKLEKIKNLLTLRHWLPRPPGTSFLGSQATSVNGWLGEYGKNPTKIIADSGSDITLISHQAWTDMENSPRIKHGEQIALVGVTGSSAISDYVTLPIYLDTDEGPIELKLEAYVVKNMISPFILGNDFADQFSISIIRNEDKTFLEFGNSGRRTQVENSIGPSLVNKDGLSFSVSCNRGPVALRVQSHKRSKRDKRKLLKSSRDRQVRATISIVIPPESCTKIPVQFNTFPNASCVYVEKTMYTHKNADDVYGCADSIIGPSHPFIHVSNFSKTPIRIHPGQSLGTAHNPRNWLDRIPTSADDPRVAHARLVQTLTKSLSKAPIPEDPNPPNSETVEGGPKTAEAPEESTTSEEIFNVLNLSPDLSPDQREQIKKIVLKNISAFSVDGRLGNYDKTLVEFPMKPDAKPVSLPPFGASSPEKRRVINEQMDAWLQLEVIEPSVSPWGAPAFIVYRQNKPRMVIDYRKLNELIIPDEFPLPRQDDILQTLTGANWLSTLDALAGFTQLQIKPEDREKTAFRTHRGLYQFRRMPFGFRNGPAVFQRVMQEVLAPFLWIFALVYIDDIVIFSKSFDDHLKHLDLVFKAIAESGITLSPKKCNLGYHSLQLLGQKVSRLGLSTVKEKVDAILQLEEPRNVKELQMFLGMMVYFSSYIPYYAWIVAPLFKLLKKNSEWEWKEVHQEAFELSKEALANSPVRGYAIPGFGYRIYTDACDYGIAAILQQVQPMKIRDLQDTKVYEKLRKAYDNKESVPRLVVSATKDNTDLPPTDTWADKFEDTTIHLERVIAYWSRTLKPAERNYSPTEREALALKDGLIKFQAFIEGEPNVIAVTDHAALTWARTYQNVNRRLLTWGTVFAAYPNVKIVHRAGRVHSNVDPISRLRRRIPYQEGPAKDGTVPAPLQTPEESPKPEFGELRSDFEAQILHMATLYARSLNTRAVPEHLIWTSVDLDGISLDVNTYANAYLVSSIAPDDLSAFVHGYAKDKHYSRILEAMRNELDASRPTYPQYSLDDDGLIRFEDALGCSRICVPQSLHVSIMTGVHEAPGDAAHGGYHKTYNRIAATYYWPRMARDIKRFVQTCDICQKIRPRRHAPYGLLQPVMIPTRPFDTISMDFIMELPDSDGYNGVLVIVDKLTKYVIMTPIDETIDAEQTATLVFQKIVAHFGLPRQVITDRDVRWTSNFWRILCNRLGVRRAFTTAHHPQADGQTEIMNQLLEIALRAYIGPDRDDWRSFLDVLQLSYNSSVHTSTKYSPAFLLRGYEPVTARLDLREPPEVDRNDLESNVWLEQLEAARKEAADAIKLAQAFQQRSYNRGRLSVEFKEGDQVLLNPHSLELLRNVKGKGRKLLARYEGPFDIIQKISPLAYRIRLPSSYGINPVINIAHLERYGTSPPEYGARSKKKPQRLDFEDLPEFDVEAIVGQDRRKVRGRWKTWYNVKFVGYPEPEWTPEENLQNAPDVVHEWKQSLARKRS